MPYQVNLRLFKFFSEPTKHNHLRSSFGSRTLLLARKSSSDREEMRPSSSSLPNAFLVLLLSMIKSKLQCTVRNSREVKCMCLRYMYLYMFLDRAVGYFFLPRVSISVYLLWSNLPSCSVTTALFLSQYNMYARYTANTHVCVNLFIYCLLQSAQNSPQIQYVSSFK